MPKKRSHGDGGLYYLKSRKLWRGVIDLGFKPDGKRDQRYVHAKTQALARERLEELKREIDEHGAPLDKSTTVDKWAAHWLETVCKPRMTPNGQASYETITRTWIVPVLGTKRMALVKPSDIRSVHQAVRTAGRSSATARKAYNVMSRMFEAARMDGIIAKNPVRDVTPPKVLAKERGALTTEQAIAVLDASSSYADGSRWWVALLLGMRQSERLGTRLESLDLERGVLTIGWALDEIMSEHGCGEKVAGVWPCGRRWGGYCTHRKLKIPDGYDYIHLHGRLALKRPKSGRPRAVPLIPHVRAALERYLEATKDWPNPYGLLWRKENGEPYLWHEDEQQWRDVLYAAGIITEEQRLRPKDRPEGTPDIPTAHWARHTTATILMRLGIDAKIVGEIVGHVDPKTTQGYQHVSSDVAREAMERLGAHLIREISS